MLRLGGGFRGLRRLAAPVKPAYSGVAVRFTPRTTVGRRLCSSAGKSTTNSSAGTKHPPPFLIRVGLVTTLVGLCTPLFTIAGVTVLWLRVAPKSTVGRVIKGAVTVVVGGGLATVTVNHVFPLLRDHSDVVLPFAAANAIACGVWYSAAELAVGIEKFPDGSAATAASNSGATSTTGRWVQQNLASGGGIVSKFLPRTPLIGAIIGGLTALTAPFLWPAMFDLCWDAEMKRFFLGEESGAAALWPVDLYTYLVLPVGLPIGLAAGTGLHFMLAPMVTGRAVMGGGSGSWLKPWMRGPALPLFAVVSAAAGIYFTLPRPSVADVYWVHRTDGHSGERFSFNPYVPTASRLPSASAPTSTSTDGAGGTLLDMLPFNGAAVRNSGVQTTTLSGGGAPHLPKGTTEVLYKVRSGVGAANRAQDSRDFINNLHNIRKFTREYFKYGDLDRDGGGGGGGGDEAAVGAGPGAGARVSRHGHVSTSAAALEKIRSANSSSSAMDNAMAAAPVFHAIRTALKEPAQAVEIANVNLNNLDEFATTMQLVDLVVRCKYFDLEFARIDEELARVQTAPRDSRAQTLVTVGSSSGSMDSKGLHSLPLDGLTIGELRQYHDHLNLVFEKDLVDAAHTTGLYQQGDRGRCRYEWRERGCGAGERAEEANRTALRRFVRAVENIIRLQRVQQGLASPRAGGGAGTGAEDENQYKLRVLQRRHAEEVASLLGLSLPGSRVNRENRAAGDDKVYDKLRRFAAVRYADGLLERLNGGDKGGGKRVGAAEAASVWGVQAGSLLLRNLPLLEVELWSQLGYHVSVDAASGGGISNNGGAEGGGAGSGGSAGAGVAVIDALWEEKRSAEAAAAFKTAITTASIAVGVLGWAAWLVLESLRK